jgi:hypothetical protein
MKSPLITASIATLFILSTAIAAADRAAVADTDPVPAASLPSGIIVMWSGPLDAIPPGWALCDGSHGTPDLSNRFVLGVGAAEYLGSTGGALTHKHRAGNHSHQIDPPALRLRPAYGYSGYRGADTRGRSYTLPEQTFNMRSFESSPATVMADAVSHLPPYFKIAFIMKL